MKIAITEQKIDVLWIDDNKDIWDSYKNYANGEGIILHPYECWEDAEIELRNNFDNYEAIILDAKCKYHRYDDPKADKFLSHVITDMRGICTQRQQIIHWYVLSAGGAEVGEINGIIHEERLMWDSDWEKESNGRSYYLKTSDEIDRLLDRIKKQISFTPTTQIKAFLHQDVFKAIKNLRLNSEAEELLIDLLLPIHYPQLGRSSEKHLIYAIRKILEHLFRALIEEWNILPTELIQKDEVALNGSSKILAGVNAGEIKNKGRIVDKITENNIRNMLTATNGYIHTAKKEIDINNVDLLAHIKETPDIIYLLRSYTMQICDLLIYMESIARKFPDKDKNREVWETIQEL